MFDGAQSSPLGVAAATLGRVPPGEAALNIVHTQCSVLPPVIVERRIALLIYSNVSNKNILNKATLGLWVVGWDICIKIFP